MYNHRSLNYYKNNSSSCNFGDVEEDYGVAVPLPVSSQFWERSSLMLSLAPYRPFPRLQLKHYISFNLNEIVLPLSTVCSPFIIFIQVCKHVCTCVILCLRLIAFHPSTHPIINLIKATPWLISDT